MEVVPALSEGHLTCRFVRFQTYYTRGELWVSAVCGLSGPTGVYLLWFIAETVISCFAGPITISPPGDADSPESASFLPVRSAIAASRCATWLGCFGSK